MRTYQILK